MTQNEYEEGLRDIGFTDIEIRELTVQIDGFIEKVFDSYFSNLGLGESDFLWYTNGRFINN